MRVSIEHGEKKFWPQLVVKLEVINRGLLTRNVAEEQFSLFINNKLDLSTLAAAKDRKTN